MSRIGKPLRKIDVEPQPKRTPAPKKVPATPAPAPKKEPVPVK